MQNSALRLKAIAGTASNFNPLNLFTAGEQGAWYDPSDLTTLFQDSAGTTPMSAVGTVADQAVGLMKDKSGRGNHAFQATAGNRPVLSARVNLLTKTEDFSDGVWSILQASKTPNYGIAPDGSQAACRFVSTVSGSYGLLYQIVPYTPIAGASYTLTIWVKSNTASSQVFRLYAQGSVYSAPITATTTWQMFTLPATSSGVNTSWGIENSTGSGYSDIDLLVWHPDLRPTNSGALLPAYQRVNTASDYDTVGFPLYLKANGLSSAMSTNSIDFSSTDKMTVVTGVRKLSDATSFIIEQSANSASNIGSFAVLTGDVTTGFISLSYSALWRASSTLCAFVSALNYVAPISDVLRLSFDLSQSTLLTQCAFNANGTSVGVSGTPVFVNGTGNFGNYPLYLFARAGTSLFLNGQFYGAIIRGAQSDTASVTQTENYMATKTGITF